MNISQFKKDLFTTTSSNFEEKAMMTFQYQASHNEVYRSFLSYLNIDPNTIHKVTEIPFLPIELFKTQNIQTGNWKEETIFTSSGTTGANTSKHKISSLSFYKKNTVEIFKKYYGLPSDYVILALLPSYLEREGSGLITMTEHFIQLGGHSNSGFYLYNHEELHLKLKQLKVQNQKTILLGVTFGLLDFIDDYQVDYPDLIIIETGGMKGRKEELTRAEVHQHLSLAFNTSFIHSEYGMTELQSQAYSTGKGLFKTPEWMKVLVRENDDPLSPAKEGKTGGINVIDLANIDTCSFIGTQDLGRLHPNGQFEILGRFDHADTRGCNLMVTGS